MKGKEKKKATKSCLTRNCSKGTIGFKYLKTFIGINIGWFLLVIILSFDIKFNYIDLFLSYLLFLINLFLIRIIDDYFDYQLDLSLNKPLLFKNRSNYLLLLVILGLVQISIAFYFQSLLAIILIGSYWLIIISSYLKLPILKISFLVINYSIIIMINKYLFNYKLITLLVISLIGSLIFYLIKQFKSKKNTP